ncbi:MAG: hypothetical protein IID33_17995, partial [Planctomycetes bacterium]|nr:hypothetical protein [Planctomycetota bacterium]
MHEMLDAVISEVDIRESIGSFDPNTLSGVPRATDASEPTLTRGPVAPPPVPALDARTYYDPDALPERLRKKADKLTRKLEKKMAKFEAKVAGKRGDRETRRARRAAVAPTAEPAQAAMPAASGPDGPPMSRKAQMFVLAAVAAGVSVGLAVIDKHGELPVRAVSIALQMAGATVGGLLAYFWMVRRSMRAGNFMDRLSMAAMAALCMIPGAIVAADDLPGSDFHMLFVPLVAMILLSDWSGRIELGRRGHGDAGDAFWPAVIGLIVGGMADAPPLIAAGMCAMVAMLTQSAAGMWAPVTTAGTRGPRQRGGGKLKGLGDELSEAAREIRQAASKVTDRGFGLGKKFRAARDEAVQDALSPAVASAARPIRPVAKAFWGVLSTLALIASVGCFFVLVLAGIHDNEAQAALLFGTLAGVAWLPFLLKKSFQRFRQPLWRGTMRFFIMSLGLTLTSGMIAIVSFARLHGEERGVAIFGLVAGSIVALVSLCIPGSKRLVAGSEPLITPPAAPPEPEQPKSHRLDQGFAPSFVGRTANAGLSAVGKFFLLGGLFCAVCYNLDSPRFELDRNTYFQISDATLHVYEGGQTKVVGPIPQAAVLAPLVLGTVFLVLARRGDGAAHLLRGFAGCALGIVAAVLAVGPAGKGIPIFLNGPWSDRSGHDMTGMVLATGVRLMLPR